jgi:hypothetical protein
MIPPYLDDLIQQLETEKVTSIVTITPSLSTDGHYRSVIVEYKNPLKKPILYPLSKNEWEEFEKYRESKISNKK